MDTIFMSSENSKTFDPHRLLVNLSGKINVNGKDKYVALSSLSIYYTWEIYKINTKIIDLKYQLRHGMKNFNYLIDQILYQIFKIILNTS